MLPLPLFVFRARHALLLGALFAVAPARAEIVVQQAWVRATLPGQQVAGAYMTIAATPGGRLLAVRSPVAGRIEIHTMHMDGNVMRMRGVDTLDLPQGRAVTLAPGGYHLMLSQLTTSIRVGDVVPLTLTVGRDGQRETVTVRAIARAAP